MDDETYETTWLIYSGKDTAQYEIFDNVENVIVFYDEQPSDNLNGELWHNDLVCKADLDAGVIYSFGRITRIYRNGAWEYTTYDNNGKETAYSDKSEAIKAVLSENQSKKVYLRKQTDKLKMNFNPIFGQFKTILPKRVMMKSIYPARYIFQMTVLVFIGIHRK